MKKTILTAILAISMAGTPALAETQAHQHGQEGEQNAPQEMMMGGQGQGMMMGQGQGMGMMGGKGMMMQGRMGCMNMMGQGMGQGMMGGGMMKHMSAENQHKFMNDTTKMRQKMHMMHFEHMEAMRNPDTKLEDLADMEQKMLDMRKEMMKKAEKYQDLKK